MTTHPHLPSLRGDRDGSPWKLLPGIALVLTVVVAVLIATSFLIADAIAGRAY
jgi:hypothetical protein